MLLAAVYCTIRDFPRTTPNTRRRTTKLQKVYESKNHNDHS